MSGRQQYAWRSPVAVAKSVDAARRAGIEHFYACYDPQPRCSLQLAEILTALAGLTPPASLSFESFGLPDRLIIGQFRKLAPESVMILSPETADEAVRRRHRAFPFSNRELELTLGQLSDAGVPVYLYFTLGLPGETQASAAATAKYAQWLRREFPCIVRIIATPVEMEPGAPWYEAPANFGITSRRTGIRDFYECHQCPEPSLGYDTADMTEAEISSAYCQFLCPISLDRCQTLRRKNDPDPTRYSYLRQHGGPC